MHLKLGDKREAKCRDCIGVLASLRLCQSIWRVLFFVFFVLALFVGNTGSAQQTEVPIYIFWQSGCPYCEQAKSALHEITQTDENVRVEEIELGVSVENDTLFRQMIALFEVQTPAVPFVVVGERHVTGFARGGGTEAVFQSLIAQCQESPCEDPVSDVRRLSGIAAGRPPPASTPQPAGEPITTVTLPWFGEIQLTDLSLPVLTVLLAGIDGFNPCAMWVLALLIGLLLGVADSRRMWTLGLVFLLATGVMYFAVMAAWLNVVLWIGAVSWIRIVIGVVAIGAGVYFLREFRVNPEGVCRVTPSRQRKRILDAFRRMVEQPSLLVAGVGIAALAIAVNLVELVCSAGVPAVYTQMLAMHDLSTAAYYKYLALYLVVFLFDDTVMFVVAMITLRSAVATGQFSRYSHLIGGAILLGLGAVMLIRPDWLS